jgi:hypothetical protein
MLSGLNALNTCGQQFAGVLRAPKTQVSDSFGTKIRKSEISYQCLFELSMHKILIDRNKQRIIQKWHGTCLQRCLINTGKSRKPLY